MTVPVLYIFAISHYCEKARWALDYLGVDYRLQHLSPVSYIKIVRGLGVPDTSLPILAGGSQTLQGSAQIIDWAEAHKGPGTASLEAGIDSTAAREIECRLDDIAGVHLRRYYYSEALLDRPHKVRPIFARDLSWHQRLVLRLAWARIRRYMIRGMDLGVAQGLESRDIVEAELDWLDNLLADGRAFLLGERFSRVDLTAASLLSPLALPPEHPAYHDLQLPPGIAADLEAWRERPSLRWIRGLYQRFR